MSDWGDLFDEWVKESDPMYKPEEIMLCDECPWVGTMLECVPRYVREDFDGRDILCLLCPACAAVIEEHVVT